MKGLYIKSIPFGKGAAGGGITHTIGMIRGFFESDAEITVVTSEAFDIEDERVVNLNVPYNADGIPFLRDYVFFRKYRKALLRWMEESGERFDFVYCRHRGFSDLPLVAKKKQNAYLVLEQNDILYDAVWTLALYPNMMRRSRFLRPLFYLAGFVLKNWVRSIEMPVLRAADLIVVVSDQMKKNLTDIGCKEAERILVLPNGVDPQLFCPDVDRRVETRRRTGIPEEHVVVGFAGTFGNWHGIPELTEAFKQIAPEQNVSLLLMGDGLMRKKMQQALSPYENAHFTGLVPFAEMPDYLSACDILVISNSWDPKFGKPFFGSPTKLFEYMSMGKAIVASRLEQIGEILTDEESALMFSPGNVEEMASAIHRLIQDSALRQALGAAARAAVIEHHTWKMNAEKIAQIVREELPEHGGKPQ